MKILLKLILKIFLLRAVLKDDEIYIKSADVYIQDEYDKDKVKDYVFEKLGINAKVYYIGE